MKNTNPVIILLFLCLTIKQSLAQGLLPDILQKQFDTYQQNNLQEKLYVHTDKEQYGAGEICWFKVYNVDAFFNTPLSISKIVYVEILDKNHKSVLQAKIPMQEGTGNGSFLLSTTLISGNYTLRAYTNWMKNVGAGYFFEKTLTVFNARETADAEMPLPEEKYTIAFFPEGGNLVQGIESTVACHIVNQYGKGQTASGIVLNNKNDTVARFKTAKFGMSRFVFKPKPTETYNSIITLPFGKTLKQPLPTAYTEGYVLHLSEDMDKAIKITVQASAQKANTTIYLLAHTRGVLQFILRGDIQDGKTVFSFNKNKIGQGITHFTVFNADKQPVCERLFFKQPKQYLQIGATSDLQTYGLHKRINMSISTTDETGKPTSADMSMAVYRLDSLQTVGDMDINNYLWLRSDLTGDIESPAYYFSQNNKETAQAADNLMLTHGWRRFNWADILQDKKPAFTFLPEYAGHLVTGKVTKNGTDTPVSKVETSLSGTQIPLRTTKSDADGTIHFELKDYYHQGRLIVQSKNTDEGFYDIKIDKPFSDKQSNRLLPPFSLPQTPTKALQILNKSVVVQTTYNSKSLKQTLITAVDTAAFYLKPDDTYLLDNYVRFTSLEEVLTEYVKTVSFRRKNNKVQLQVWDNLRNKFFELEPLVLLDGTPVLDMDKLMSYDPLKIQRLEIVSRMYYLGNMSYPGILNFMTYKGNMPDYVLDPHTTIVDYEGLQRQRVFYAPEYETTQQASSRLPDFRNLLYWDPSVKTNKNGVQTLHFYSSDLRGRYVSVLQGLTKDGKTGSKVILFEVK